MTKKGTWHPAARAQQQERSTPAPAATWQSRTPKGQTNDLTAWERPRRPGQPEIPPGAWFAHVHEIPAELGKRYEPELAIVGGAGETINALLDQLHGADTSTEDQLDHVRAQRQRYLEWRKAEPNQGGDEQPLPVATVSALLDEELPSDVVIVDEAIRSARTFMRHFRLPAERAYHRSTGGAIGWGLPAAIGVQLAVGCGRQVVGLIGDGSALMTMQSLWTAAHHDIPVLAYILNNRAYHAVQVAVGKHRGESTGSADAQGSRITEPDPDFVGLATSLGVDAVRATTPDQLVKSTRRALDGGGPALIEVMTPPNEA